MKKKYLYSLLTLAVAICGFSAWSVSGGVSPQADGDEAYLTPVLDQCYPAESSTVSQLDYFLITFPEEETDIQINPAYTSTTLASISSLQADGTYKVAQSVRGSQNFDKMLNGKEVASNQIVYHLSTPLTPKEVNQYRISINAGVFISGTTGHTSQLIRLVFNIDPDYVPEPTLTTFDYGFSYGTWGIDNNYDYTYKYVTNDFGSNVTFLNLPSGVTLDSSKSPVKWIRESDGTVVEADVRNFYGSMLMFTETATWPEDPFGVWTCTLPQGLFVSGDEQSVEKTLKLTWVNPNAADPKPEFEVTRVSFFDTPDCFKNVEGQPAGVPQTMMYTLWATVDGGQDMMNWETDAKSIACLNSNRGFVFNTSWDEYIECFIAEVKRKDGKGDIDVWNQETVQEIYGSGVYCKNYVGSSAADCEAYPHPLLGCGGNPDVREYESGVEYTFDIYFYDSMQKRGMDTSEHNLACGSYHFEFTGATAAYDYSTLAELVSVSPVPVNATELGLADETAGVLNKVTEPITFTWSAPVTMTAKYSLGGGAGLANVQSCTSNDDKTVWTVVPGASVISNGEGGYLSEFEFNVQAIDADGRYVKGNVGEKDNTMFVPIFKFDIESAVNGVEFDGLNVISQNGGIKAVGLSEGMNVALYTLNGMKLAAVAASDSVVEFANLVPGNYLIVVTAADGSHEAFKLLHK